MTGEVWRWRGWQLVSVPEWYMVKSGSWLAWGNARPFGWDNVWLRVRLGKYELRVWL